MSAEDKQTPGSQSLTSTKLDPPALPVGLIERPGLLRRLTKSTAAVVLIDAPAGWGKSSALAAWSHSADEQRSFAFVRLGREDNDPRAFWSYIVAAVHGTDETVPTEIADFLAAPGSDPLRTLVPSLINSLNSGARSIVLALDDYHQITNAAIHGSVEYLIEHAPRGFHLVISSRTDPPFPLARWRAAGWLEEVRLGDLRMSTSDTLEMLATRFGVSIEQSDAELLCQRTEGWPAGIQLAGVSLAGDPDPADFIQTFAGNDRNIADYLTNEVLGRQTNERSDFLLATSLLDVMTAELCDHLLETTGSVRVLQEIEQENLFLVSLDSRREWFRYHHLFQEWLSHSLRIAESSERIVQLHSRAAEWFHDNGFLERAVDHLLAAGNSDDAASIIDVLLSRLAFVHEGTVRQWLPAIPDPVASRYPRICLAQMARCLTHADYSGARRWDQTLGEALAAAPADERETLRPHVGVYRGLLKLPTSSLDATEREFRSVVDDETHRASAPASYARGLLGIALFWSAGPREALPHLQQGSRDRQRLSMGDTGITPLLAAAHAELGDWDDCESALSRAFALPEMRWSSFPDLMPAHYANARLLNHQGLNAEAVDAAQRGLDQATAWPVPAFAAWGWLVLSDIASDPAEKRRLLTEAEMNGALHSGRHYLGDAIARARERLDSRWPVIAADGAVAATLTRREIEVLRLFRSDLSLREIGRELDITLNTAKGYAKAIYQKLGVSSRAEAVTVATAAGVI